MCIIHTMNAIELSGVDQNLLLVLAVLLEEASVTRAAARLGRTQSAVSHALDRLRTVLGDPLFVRSGRRLFPTPRDDLPYDDIFSLPARLEAAGVSWCLSSGEESANERNLPYAAGAAVAYGLDPAIALEAITIRPARILGIADAYGSIEQGKSATLILADGDILEITTNVQAAFIDGRTLDMSDKHKALAAKYREKYRQLKAAPGTPPNAAPDAPAPKPPAPSPAPAPASTPPAPAQQPPAGDTPSADSPR